MSLDPQIYKQTMGQWATGVTVVTTIADGIYYGMTANSFISVSINPLLILISVDHKAQIHPLITKSQVFAVSILNAAHSEWGKRFAGFNKEIIDRFEGIPFETAVTGSPVLPRVIGWVDCRVYTTYQAGDHTLFLGEVLAAQGPGGADPLMYFNRVWGTFKALE